MMHGQQNVKLCLPIVTLAAPDMSIGIRVGKVGISLLLNTKMRTLRHDVLLVYETKF
jgi:hypothetical protein